MANKKNILVFPCGSEIALEVYRSVKNSTHFNLIGASSIDDHGKFVFENYVDGLPFITAPDFIPAIKKIVADHAVDAIYPAMDAVIEILKKNEKEIGCKVIASDVETTQICLSKTKTYKALGGTVKIPKVLSAYKLLQVGDSAFPIFAKPDIGYGSRGAKKITSVEDLKAHMDQYPSCILSEFLPGKEYTVDCFTASDGELLFAAARERSRIMNGISVNTKPVKENPEEFEVFARKINGAIKFRGAWFYQVKRDASGELTLLEVASRFGGSSSLFRAQGINFALMSLFESGEGTSEVTLTMTRLGVPALRTISLHFMIAAVAIVLTNVFQAIGKGMYSLIISLCRQLLVLLPAAYLLKSIFGTVGSVWWTFLIAEAVSLTLSLVFYRKCDREILSRL